MGQKVNPISLRLQIHKNWHSQWFANKTAFAGFLQKDLQARQYIEQKLGMRGAVNKIIIERHSGNTINITIYTARVGVVIGRSGSNVQEMSLQLYKLYKIPIKIGVEEIKRFELHAKLVAENIAQQLERRLSYRRTIKNAANATMRAGASGIRIEVAGRIAGQRMSRRDREIQGSVPLHKLRADIDYGVARARFPNAGIIGIKVWINKGEKF
ncbi:MAG: 30S ribosomal protein S3 [Candidatus Saccharibacteria bacterium]|nr:30S ribosomal protein S3 [Candidatus Saccharibacteria bacterium]